MNILHISKIIEDMRLGSTGPMHAVSDSGQHAVIKVFHNGQGNKVLFNEYFAYHLAHLLEIPTPDFFVGLIDEKTQFDIAFDLKNMGYCFCSAYIDHATTVIPDTIKWIDNQ